MAQHRTRLGGVRIMRQNPWNAAMCLGHANGRLTLWTPNITEPVVSIQGHLGPVRALAVDNSGTYMASAGADKQVHVWDLRKAYRRLHSYFAHAPPSALDVSHRDMLAVGFGSQVRSPALRALLDSQTFLRACSACLYPASSHALVARTASKAMAAFAGACVEGCALTQAAGAVPAAQPQWPHGLISPLLPLRRRPRNWPRSRPQHCARAWRG